MQRRALTVVFASLGAVSAACSHGGESPDGPDASDAAPHDATLVDTSFAFDATLGPDAPLPDAIACGADGDSGACPLPPSVCVDGQWLAYYTNGHCVDGACRYDAETESCATGCANGGCLPRATK